MNAPTVADLVSSALAFTKTNATEFTSETPISSWQRLMRGHPQFSIVCPTDLIGCIESTHENRPPHLPQRPCVRSGRPSMIAKQPFTMPRTNMHDAQRPCRNQPQGMLPRQSCMLSRQQTIVPNDHASKPNPPMVHQQSARRPCKHSRGPTDQTLCSQNNSLCSPNHSRDDKNHTFCHPWCANNNFWHP